MGPNDSNWKVPSYKRLEELLKKQFSSSVNHVQVGFIDDTMSYELYDAARDENGDASKFLDVLERVSTEKQLDCSTILHQATPTGDSLLHVAAEHGRTRIAELLVDNNFLLIVTNIKKDTALHVAARAKKIGVMRVILSKFDDASSKDNFIMLPNKFGNRALHEAILSKHREGFDFLLSEQSESTWPLYWDTHPADSPIYMAVQTGDLEILRRLLQIPFPSDRIIYKSQGNSPLFAAISERNIAVLKEIVDKKEELMFLTDEDGNTPLHYAAFTGYVEGVRELLNKSTLVAFQRNSKSNLPIHFACGKGHIQVVEELLRVQGPCTSFSLNNEGRNILHIASMRGKSKMVKYLLKHPKINSKTVNEKDLLNGDTPLHLASRKLYLWTLDHLSRDKRIIVNLVNDQGLTAIDIIRSQSKFPMTRIEVLILEKLQFYKRLRHVTTYLLDLITLQLGAYMIVRFAGASRKYNNKLRRKRVVNKAWNENDGANTLIIVAVLVATVTFAAGFTIPGGVYSSDYPVPIKRGMAVLTDQTLFKIFMTFNTIAMYCSTFGTILLLWRHLPDRRVSTQAYHNSKIFVQLALGTMPVAFVAAILLVVRNDSFLAYLTSIIAFIFVFVILLLGLLGYFPTRSISLPVFRQVGLLLLWFGIILFYGSKDGVFYFGEIPQDDDNATQEKNRVT
ncbi:protein ACCELERATED CELL DEATH 6-like [Prosopis cineraria]|uniref:protein ACCELERATED CELL DEATH 6-like n=1 Tax=Prosopis cineraria TaxID=364024 RepID=UPI0024106511|nr:protein ACCELERATED CELL DEATH 6-like [Prosopis cineraria]